MPNPANNTSLAAKCLRVRKNSWLKTIRQRFSFLKPNYISNNRSLTIKSLSTNYKLSTIYNCK